MVFFGDGAGQTGAFHESLNIAALWKLPLVFVCENNGYVEFTPLSAHTLVEQLANYAATYGIPRITVDGNDVLAVREAASEAVERGRSGNGPSFVECLTYRLRGHYEGDPAKYRELSELDEWTSKDPILRFERFLKEMPGYPDGDMRQIEDDAREQIERAAQVALDSPWPARADLTNRVIAG